MNVAGALAYMKKGLLNLVSIQLLFWFGWQFACYQNVYFQDIGMTTSEIGIMSAMCSLVSLFASIMWGYIADKMNSIKNAFILDLIVTMAFLIVLPILPAHFQYASVMFILFKALSSIGQGPLGTLIDNHAVRNCEQGGLNYGTVTAFRCVSGALGGLACTLVLGWIEIRYAPWMAVAFMIPALACVFASNDPKSASQDKKKREKVRIRSVVSLFGDYYFSTFIIFTALFSLAHNAIMIFVPYLMADIGIAENYYGTYLSSRTITAIPFLFIFGEIRKRMKLKNILILSCILMGAESLLLGLVANNLVTFLLCAAVYGVGSGLFLGVTSLYIYKLTPDHLKASAHNLYASSCVGVGIIGNLVGGVAYDSLGSSNFFLMLGSIMIGSAVIFLVTLVVGRLRRLENRADL